MGPPNLPAKRARHGPGPCLDGSTRSLEHTRETCVCVIPDRPPAPLGRLWPGQARPSRRGLRWAQRASAVLAAPGRRSVGCATRPVPELHASRLALE